MSEARSVRVEAVIARAPAPPGCAAPFPIEVDWWPGTLLAWRWTNRETRTWTALVRYQRDGLMHEHWVNGDLLDVEPEQASTPPDVTGPRPAGAGRGPVVCCVRWSTA